TADLHVGTAAIDGTDAAQFAIANDSCSGQTLAPTASCTLDVTFGPTSLGAKSARLAISSDDSASPATAGPHGSTPAPAAAPPPPHRAALVPPSPPPPAPRRSARGHGRHRRHRCRSVRDRQRQLLRADARAARQLHPRRHLRTHLAGRQERPPGDLLGRLGLA